MRISFNKRKWTIAWEYLAAPFLLLLALIVLLSFRLSTQKVESIRITEAGTVTPIASQTPEVTQSEQAGVQDGDAAFEEQGEATDTSIQVGSRLDINTASIDELVALPYIGEVKAKAIVEYRTRNGPYKTVEDLLNVKGIGPKTLEKLKPYIEVKNG